MTALDLEVRDLHVSYGNVEAVKGVTIQVPKGKIVALLGANGAGKTTTLKSIAGLVEASKGNVQIGNDGLLGLSPSKITRKGVVLAPEGRQIFPTLTVDENLRIGAFTVRKKEQIRENYERVFRYFPILKERSKQVAGTLSGGEQQMLAIGRALMANPKILLLDEPSLGLAPLIVANIFNIIKEINEQGTTILIIEQNALQTLKIADYAYILEVGKVKLEGEASSLIQDKKLLEAYLGEH